MHAVIYEPRTLRELLQGDSAEYRLSIGYVVQLTSLEGSYPIIERTTSRMVAFTDFDTAKRVWACMSPAESYVSSILVFCNKRQGIGFLLRDMGTGEPDSHPICVVDDVRYREMGDACCDVAFCWAPGLPQPKRFDSAVFDRIIASAKDPANS